MRVLAVDDNRDDLEQIQRCLIEENDIDLMLCDRPTVCTSRPSS